MIVGENGRFDTIKNANDAQIDCDEFRKQCV